MEGKLLQKKHYGQKEEKHSKEQGCENQGFEQEVDHLNKVVSQCFQFHQNRLTSPCGGC